ncbi:MAG: LytTR family transcriptional regulator DNA-binding domain-containing protein [Bacteroidetes bacterium]|nr:LytTR family transcriptional regulator DNA-binding domain-containing protein [Bacteroidota bacterium]MBP6427690.1 LytTR family transcriptional regulator DNA-binding domain-containing protein [Bacteroidia bacterium]MBP6657879.1 LytTR family transcriptional regulator DNA-binding domain-containing protein [Bacteroidia bacterium]
MTLQLLNQPYPFSLSQKKKLIQAFMFGLFVFLFLAIFQPFGLLSYKSESKLLHILGYGAITSFSMLLSNSAFTFIFPKWYNFKSWTVGKNIVYILWMFLFIGMNNWIYSVLLGFWGFSIKAFFIFQAITLLIGVFPVTISTFIIYHNRLKAALQEAQSLNQNIQAHQEVNEKLVVKIPSQNKSEDLSVELDNLLYVKAVENYVEVCLNNKKVILRNTLKAVEQSLADFPHFKRCHRSYLVNLQKIKSFSGNAQGLSLRFEAPDAEEIPVSRAYVPQIKAAL